MRDLGIVGEVVKFGGFGLNCFQIMHFQTEVRARLKRAQKLHYTVISKKGNAKQRTQSKQGLNNSELFIHIDSVISLTKNKAYFVQSLSHSQHEKYNM